MGWWGKLIGGGLGFLMGGPIGALLGAAFGHQLDKGINQLEHLQGTDPGDTERTQAAFFTAVFSVMGHIAKVDGQVSKDEIRMAEHIMAQMQLSPDQRKAAIELFNQGKLTDFPLHEVLKQFRRECHRRRNLIQMFMEILITTGLADGVLDQAERIAIYDIGQQLLFSSSAVDQLIQMVTAQQHYVDEPSTAAATLDDAYSVLGIAADASDADIKKAYRRQMSQHHPDKLVSKGLPEEMIKLATEKTQEIKAAYDQIKKARKLH